MNFFLNQITFNLFTCLSVLLVLTGLFVLPVTFVYAQCSCQSHTGKKIDLIFDTDANNEIDDQYALAYLLFNGNRFSVEGITVNATYGGGEVELHYEEAKRIVKLSNLYQRVPILKGANSSFNRIREQVDKPDFDGYQAVEFIIGQAMKEREDRLVLLAVGKLTNIALALRKEPEIASKVHVVWLGSNYPDPGEYNQDNDPGSLNYLLNTDVPFDMVTVRYGEPSGTDAVKVSLAQIRQQMPGMGPNVFPPVEGRHGGTFRNFGDYGVNLFENYPMDGEPPSRPLYDMAAVAILKNPSWAQMKMISAPILIAGEWQERPENPRKIALWENFDIYGILNDFFITMRFPELINQR